MGKIDVLTKDYISDNNIFADVFNYFMYDGEKVIEPQQLKELDTTEIAIPYGMDADLLKPSDGEYLSGFYKSDRLIPVITLVLYMNAGEWDGPTSLHEMLSVQDEMVLSFVPDYKINLIAPASMTKEEIDKMHTNLREVFLFIKYSKDKQKLRELVREDKSFAHIDRQAVQVINAVTNSKIKISEANKQKGQE